MVTNKAFGNRHTFARQTGAVSSYFADRVLHSLISTESVSRPIALSTSSHRACDISDAFCFLFLVLFSSLPPLSCNIFLFFRHSHFSGIVSAHQIISKLAVSTAKRRWDQNVFLSSRIPNYVSKCLSELMWALSRMRSVWKRSFALLKFFTNTNRVMPPYLLSWFCKHRFKLWKWQRTFSYSTYSWQIFLRSMHFVECAVRSHSA